MALKVGQSLEEALNLLPDADVRKTISSLTQAYTKIAELCRDDLSHKTSTTNKFGDEQLALDVAADAAIMDAVRACGTVRIASSEETPYEVKVSETGGLVVAWDPLDGSSILPSNWAVGSIAGVWRGERLVGACGEDMVASVIGLYGSRTTGFVAVREGWSNGQAVEIWLGDGVWRVGKVLREMPGKKVFAPANLRASLKNVGYKRLVDWYMKERYTLRYSGGMVPDVTQLLLKGGGVFVSPVSEDAPAKLRMAYEVMPMAFLVEMAGGASSNGKGSVLEKAVKECEERTAVCFGSKDEVERFEAFCNV